MSNDMQMTPQEAARHLEAHRYLVTVADSTVLMQLQLLTGSYANWIESRTGPNGETWLVTVFHGDSGQFTEAAALASATVQEIHSGWGIDSGQQGERYVLVAGDPELAWQPPEPSGREVRFSFRLPASLFGEFARIDPGAIKDHPGEPILIGTRGEDQVAFSAAGPEEERSAWNGEAQFEAAAVDPDGEGVVITLRMPGWEPPSSWLADVAPVASQGRGDQPPEDPALD